MSSAATSSASTDVHVEGASLVGDPSLSQPPPVTNDHPMVTRAKNGVFKPRVFLTDYSEVEPTSVKAALQTDHWRKAMSDEYEALMKNNTWSVVPQPKDKKIIGCKWIFKIKRNTDGTIARYKARLVAKGFHQEADIDFTETFSPVVKSTTIRVLFTMALANNWTLRQVDINNAFLHGELTEDVYMMQPSGFEVRGSTMMVCKLHRALYGLKQAPRAWFERLSKFLHSLGFHTSKADSSLLIRFSTTGSRCFILVYVDDIIITGSNQAEIDRLVHQLHTTFSLKDLGQLGYFLGIEVSYPVTGGMFLSQSKYVCDLLHKTKMHGANSIATPMISGAVLSAYKGEKFADVHLYRSTVGALQYVTLTRPELAYSVNKVCQFMHAPTLLHWQAVKRILRYLAGTYTHGLFLRRSSELVLHGFADADWASDPDDRRSTSGFCLFFGGNLIHWASKKQTVISRSSTEAEYRSLAHAAAEMVWLCSLFTDLQLPLVQRPIIWCDNLSAVHLSANPVLHSKAKHVEIDIYFVRDLVLQKRLAVGHVPASEQVADILTKPLSAATFLPLSIKLNVASPLHIGLRGGVKQAH